MNWGDRQRGIEAATDQAVSDYYYNWHCVMCNGFGGSGFPSDYPRGNLEWIYTLNGRHMCFNDVKRYAKVRLGELPDV